MFLAIDLGSTSFKAALFDASKHCVGAAAAHLNYLRRDVEVEISETEVLNSFKNIISGAIADAGISPADIKGIGITSQAQTFTVTDEAGLPRMPFVSWLDKSAEDTCARMSEQTEFRDFAEHSGFASMLPNLQICSLFHAMKERPLVFSGKWKLMPLPSLLIFLLTGRHITDDNLASMSGFYSLRTGTWNKSYFSYCGLDEECMPGLVRTGVHSAEVFPENHYALPDGIPVYSCGNDQTAGAYGAGLEKEDILISLGTALAVYRCAEKLPCAAEGLIRGIYPGGLYYGMFAGEGGSLISKAIEKLPAFRDFEGFSKYAAKADGKYSAVFSVDERTGEVCWSDDNASAAEKARAVLEYLGDRISEMTERLLGLADAKMPAKVYLSGGGCRSGAWLDILTRKLGYDFQIIETSPLYGVIKMMKNMEAKA